MFAQRVKLYVANYHHIGAFMCENGFVDECVGILTVATCGIDHGLGCAHGGLDKPFAGYVLAQQCDYGLVVACYLCDGLV